jgi:hypothetical protein
MEARRVELNFVDNRRCTKQRTPRRLHDEPLDIHEIASTAAFANMYAVGFQFERVGIKRNAADSCGPVELLAELLFGDVANQRRRREKAQQTEQYDEDEQTCNDAPCAPRLRDVAHGPHGRGE